MKSIIEFLNKSDIKEPKALYECEVGRFIAWYENSMKFYNNAVNSNQLTDFLNNLKCDDHDYYRKLFKRCWLNNDKITITHIDGAYDKNLQMYVATITFIIEGNELEITKEVGQYKYFNIDYLILELKTIKEKQF